MSFKFGEYFSPLQRYFSSRSIAFRVASLVLAGALAFFALSLLIIELRSVYWGVAYHRVVKPLAQTRSDARQRTLAEKENKRKTEKVEKRDSLRQAGSLSSPYVEVGEDEIFPLLVRVWLNIDSSHTAHVFNNDERFPLVYERAVSAQGFVPVVGLTFGDNSFDIEVRDSNGNKVARHKLSAKIEDKEDVRSFISVKKKAAQNDFVSMAIAWGGKIGVSHAPDRKLYYGVIDDLGDIRWLHRGENPTPSPWVVFGSIVDKKIFITGSGTWFFMMDVFGDKETIFDGKNASDDGIDYYLHHDTTLTDKNTMLLLANPRNQEGNLLSHDDIIIEVDISSGKIIREMDQKNLLSDVFDVAAGPRIEDYALQPHRKNDWLHLNSISYDAASETILLSARNQSAVFALDYETGALEWMFAHSEGLTKQQQARFLKVPEGYVFHKGQHDAQLEGNRLRFFDNAVLVKKEDGSYTDPETTPSRIVEARLDLANKRITDIKTYAPKLIFSKVTSGYDFHDGKYLICYCGIMKDAFGGYINDSRNLKGLWGGAELFEFKKDSNRELLHVSIRGNSFRPRYFDWKKMVGAK